MDATNNPRTYELRPVGWVESPLTSTEEAPKQGDEGAPPADIVLFEGFASAAADLHAGAEVLVLTWLHRSNRDTLMVHPRSDPDRPLQGVFSTRSPARPNPIGLHVVTIESVHPGRFTVRNLEAIDGTPVLDVKPTIGKPHQR